MSGPKKISLETLRQAIDKVDTDLLRLLDVRAGLAGQVGEWKRQRPGRQIYDPNRERKVLARLQALGAGTFPKAAILYTFREIIGACRSLETPMTIAFLGPSGTFTQMAAARSFGQSATFAESPQIRGVFEMVARSQAQFGVVPFENSAEGGVRQTLIALEETSLQICGEIEMKIEHCLVARTGDLKALRKIYSHPQALAQCRRWLHANLPHATVVEADSTAAAAEKAARDAGTGAIASRPSAERLHLRVLREGIQDQAGNTTRFVIIALDDAGPTGHDRTSLLCMVPKADHLKEVLRIFDRAGIHIARLESLPQRGERWRQKYFLDLWGHRGDPKIKRALEKISASDITLKIFGSFPVAAGVHPRDVS